MTEPVPRPSWTWVRGSLVAFSGAAMVLSWATGARHDYVHYLEQWSHTMAGGDPWDQSLHGQNPGYGPLFNAFAPLAQLFSLLPKLGFTAAWIGTAVAVARLYEADSDSRRLAPAVLAYFALTPYFWIEIALYGHFDILPAAATLASVHLTLKGRAPRGAGMILAMGALLKIVPAAALPFLVAARPHRWKAIVLPFAGTCAAVLLASYVIWGQSTFTALMLPGRQESDLFSIFRFARGSYSPLRLITENPVLDAASIPLVIFAGALLVVMLAWRRAHVVVSVVVTFMVLFALFKLGHPQFQMLVFVMVPYLLLTLPARTRGNRVLLKTLGVYVAWFSFLDLLYVAGNQLREPPWVELREVLGLPTFVLTLIVAVLLLKFRHQPLVVPAPSGVGELARDTGGTGRL
ncbi:MAG: DUF2029 domain-containing protein [Gemmatimonadales bacterium]|nr:DUF2029 domain-containing protein [Gemmatimonadales bacterium]